MAFSLYLYPQILPGEIAPLSLNKKTIIQSLIENNIVKRLDSCSNRFLAGCRLMEFITFLGCSPSLINGEIESEINIHSYNEIVGMGGESVNVLRYPGCKHPINEPAKLLKIFLNQIHWQCPECSNKGHIDQINWRKSAAFSSLFIEISPIFPKEAIPTDALLTLLSRSSQIDWAWFYSKSTA